MYNTKEGHLMGRTRITFTAEDGWSKCKNCRIKHAVKKTFGGWG